MSRTIESTLSRTDWLERANRHRERAETLTADHRNRRSRGEKHAIEDFLYTYYPLRPGHLAQWSPGVGVTLAHAAGSEFDGARWFTLRGQQAELDRAAFLADRGGAVRFHHRLLTAVQERPGSFSCFGLHEWAMVYHAGADRRHPLPLRLGQRGTDEVVESHRIACSHYDAFRFFMPDAVALNELQPTRERQLELDQPGCLHVGMDLLKTVLHLGPAVPGEVALDAFELARAIRELDMRASPYDVSEFGLTPVAIETPVGKAEYVTAQRDFTQRAARVRQDLLATTSHLLR